MSTRPAWLPRQGDVIGEQEGRFVMALLQRLIDKDGPPPSTAVKKYIYLAYDQEGFILSHALMLLDTAVPVTPSPSPSPVRKWWIYYADSRREVVFHRPEDITLEKHQYGEVNMPYALFICATKDGQWRCESSAVPS